jgi:hypothetical protein
VIGYAFGSFFFGASKTTRLDSTARGQNGNAKEKETDREGERGRERAYRIP